MSISRDVTRVDPRVTGNAGAIEIDSVLFAEPGPATAWLHGLTEHSAELGGDAAVEGVVALPHTSRALPDAGERRVAVPHRRPGSA